MSEFDSPASPAEPERHSEFGRIMGLFEQWDPADTLDREARAAIDQHTEYLSMKAVTGLPSGWPGHPTWPKLRDWVVDPPVKIPRGTTVSFVCVEEEERRGIKFDFTQSCIAEFEFNTPSDGTFKHFISLSSPKTVGLPSLKNLRAFVHESVSNTAGVQEAVAASFLGELERPHFDENAYRRFSDLLDRMDELILRLTSPGAEPETGENGEPLPQRQADAYAYWAREEIRQVIEEAYEVGRKVREAELRARFEDWATKDRERRSEAGKTVSREARKLANQRYETILKFALACRASRSTPPSNTILYEYLIKHNTFQLGDGAPSEEAWSRGMPGRQYFEKIMQRVRKDSRWQVRPPKAETL